MNNVSFLKRMIVIVYDGLLLLGVIMVGYAVLFAIFLLLPESAGASHLGKTVKVIYLLAASFAFYGWFWTHGGQTLGMKAWNLYLVDQRGKFISWPQALVRYATALVSWVAVAVVLYFAGVARWYLAIGLGFTWMLVHKRNLAWHDILSGTHIVQLPKAGKAGKE